MLLLLPVAAASGWFIARRHFNQQGSTDQKISTDYFKGINFVLNEQPDKAIEIFVNMLEVDSHTVETHLALGNLFRKRGEAERAIRIHQNLIARPNLSRLQRSQALLELGQDYMLAGLLDRAENLFNELLALNEHTVPALRYLKDIYEQEKEWTRAILVAQKLEHKSKISQKNVIANYYCEMAERSMQQGENIRSREHIGAALSTNPGCVRASILRGRMEVSGNNDKAAIRSYKKVFQQDPDYFPEVMQPLLDCMKSISRPAAIKKYFSQVLPAQHAVRPVIIYCEYLKTQYSENEAIEFLSDYLTQHPSLQGLNYLLEFNNTVTDEEFMMKLKKIIEKLLTANPAYVCSQCGFSGKKMHWQCPGCKSWNSVSPHQDILGV